MVKLRGTNDNTQPKSIMINLKIENRTIMVNSLNSNCTPQECIADVQPYIINECEK